MQEIIVSEYNPKAKRFPENAFCMAFVYAESGNFVVKGFSNDVYEYIHNHYPKALYNMTWWHNGEHRPRCSGLWRFTNQNIYVHKIDTSYYHAHKNDLKKKRGWVVWKYKNSKDKPDEVLYFRRLPRKWIPEFDT